MIVQRGLGSARLHEPLRLVYDRVKHAEPDASVITQHPDHATHLDLAGEALDA